MGKKILKRILFGFLAATSLVISACGGGGGGGGGNGGEGGGGGGGGDFATSYTVTFYSSADSDARRISLVIPAGEQIDSIDFPVNWADNPNDGRVFLEWSVNSAGKGDIIDEDSVINSDLSLYPIWGNEITLFAQITDFDGVYKLVSDVNLGGNMWSPVGVGPVSSFRGVLYGDGHIVTGLRLPSANYSGLFGVLDNAYIRDLHVGLNSTAITNTNTSIKVGGIAGYAYNGSTISNVSVSGDLNLAISGDSEVGLIVGRLESSTVSNSFSTGSLTASSPYSIYAGGIAGYIENGAANNNYVLGMIIANTSSTTPSTSAYAGGIAGYANSGSVIASNVVVSPSVSAANSGWIAGDTYGAQFSNNYFLGTNAQTFAINDNDGVSVAVVDLAFFRSIEWDFGNAWAAPEPDRIYFYPVAKRENAAVWVNVDFHLDEDEVLYKVVYDLLTDISSVPHDFEYFLLWDSNPNGRGDFVNAVKATGNTDVYGIEGKTIANAEELAAIAGEIDGDTYNYMLVDNIDLSNYGAWTPIGNTTNRFISTFYGNGYTISGINLADVENTGLFGYIEKAYIRDLTLNASTIISQAAYVRNAGVLAAEIGDDTYINNITVTGTINIATNAGLLYLGGIAGEVSSDISNSNVSATVYGASTNSNSIVGGIAGHTHSSTISNCVTTGAIEASSAGTVGLAASAGGIAGLNESATITTSYTTGSISAGTETAADAATASAGGIVGYNYGNIFATYSTGNVSAITAGAVSLLFNHRAHAGGIAGQSEGTISVSYSSGTMYSYAFNYPHSAGIVGDFRGTSSRVYRSVAANATLTASLYLSLIDWYSGRIAGYANDNAAFPNVSYNYAYSNMLINGIIRTNSAKDGTSKTMRDLGLQQTYEELNKVSITGAEALTWDFINTWKTDGESLPIFIWQN